MNTKSLFTLLISFGSFLLNAQNFIHPGISHKKSDLDRIKHMVNAQIDPWYSSYQEMESDLKSGYNYTVQGNLSFTELGRDSGVNYGAWNTDIRAAYYNAIRWYVTEDSRHADKAIEIFNAWVNLQSVTSGGTDALSGGVAHIMIEAAEIIKHTYSGWSDTDREKFEDMLVYPGYSNIQEPSGNTTFYWKSFQGDPVRHGNQGLSGWRTIMAMGVFLDNQIMYDRALNYIKDLDHRSDDLPYPLGPHTTNQLLVTTDFQETWSIIQNGTDGDYRYNEAMVNYIWENGQCQESSRDQQHTMFGIGLLTSMAEMAWNQGENLYGFENDRLLLGLEYNMRYNVSAIQTYTDQPSPWQPDHSMGEFIQRFDRTGRWNSLDISPEGIGGFGGVRPVFEMPVAHYLGRGLKTEDEVLWITRARDVAIASDGFEAQGWTNDALGWGALTARRPNYCYGDPISGFDSNGLPQYNMNIIPPTLTVVEAENFDYDPINDGEGRIYHDLSATNTGGEYRTMDNVDLEASSEGGFNLTSIESGEWLTYTVSFPETAIYSITMRYAASESGGAIKFSLGGDDITADVAVPFGAPNSIGDSDWQDYIISEDIVINKGVQSLKISFSGVSESFKLNNFSFERTEIIKQDQSIEFPAITEKDLTSSDFDPEAIASSGLDVDYSSSNTAVATIVDGKVHIVGEGQTTITASQVGNDFYNAASIVLQELTVVNLISSVTLIVSDDSYVWGANPDSNYNTVASVVTKQASGMGRVGYYKFDISSINRIFEKATLRLRQRTRFTEERLLYSVEDDSWTENTITWNNKPDEDVLLTTFTPIASDWVEIDITTYALEQYNAVGDNNISLFIDVPVDGTQGVDFISNANIATDQFAQLVIDYNTLSLNNKEEVSIEIHPNPILEELNISLTNSNLNINDVSIRLYTINGVKVIESKPKNSEIKLDLSQLKSGVYILKIDDTLNNSIIKKVVKQ